VSFFFGGTNALRTGFEVGYAGLGGAEEGLPAGNNPGVAAVEWASSNRNMYHATFSARHNFMSTGPAGLYAGAGTGIYAVRNINEFWQQLPGSSNRLDYERSTNLAFNLGLNFGGGIEVRPLRSLGAVDLDARFHFLPFNSAANVRSVFIFSAGLRIF
jgi:hypothetical protein